MNCKKCEAELLWGGDNDYEDYMNLKQLYEHYMETYGHADNDLESVVRRPIVYDAHIIIGEIRMLKKKFEEDLENIVYNKNV